MLGHSHATSGALAWALVAPSLPQVIDVHLAPADILVGAVVCAGAALLPDLDHPSSTIAHSLGPISKVLTKFVNAISGGHRHATHSLFFVALLWAGVWAGEQYIGHYFTLGLTFILLALASRALHLCPPGDGIHSWGVIVVEAAVGVWIVNHWLPSTPQWLPSAVALGCLTHIVGDCLTERGCPVFWPIKKRLGIPLISHTGNRLETWFLTPAMVLGTLAALWFLTPAQPSTTSATQPENQHSSTSHF